MSLYSTDGITLIKIAKRKKKEHRNEKFFIVMSVVHQRALRES